MQITPAENRPSAFALEIISDKTKKKTHILSFGLHTFSLHDSSLSVTLTRVHKISSIMSFFSFTLTFTTAVAEGEAYSLRPASNFEIRRLIPPFSKNTFLNSSPFKILLILFKLLTVSALDFDSMRCSKESITFSLSV